MTPGAGIGTATAETLVPAIAAGHDLRECDLVMKGGITSGIIYPTLIAKLAYRYRFRAIGGTSAGAMAAGAAAAAELGRRSGRNLSAFDQLASMPFDLGARQANGRSRLLGLFQPSRETTPHFAVIVAALDAKSGAGRAARIARALANRFGGGLCLGALPGALLVWEDSDRPLALAFGLLIAMLGGFVGALVMALGAFARGLADNFFGICSGMPSKRSRDQAALTPWLHEQLNRLAGKRSNSPLTFGELWTGELRGDDGTLSSRADAAIRAGAPREIDLATLTTALGLGRPFRIPFETNNFFFRRDEFERLFPTSVVEWMCAHARVSTTCGRLNARPDGRQEFFALPEPKDLPVLFAVRLSLSFPILLSAVPLHVVDFSRAHNQDHGALRATRVLLSDGGICSNFPIHFFDVPLPSRPTFGVNLRPFHPDRPHARVVLPRGGRAGLIDYVPELPEGTGLSAIRGFVGAIVTTMQNWRDQVQLSMPGYRDRIVHVCQGDDEGGLNLDMTAESIQRLANAGERAADELVSEFADGEARGWVNHRRTRARTALALIQDQLEAIRRSLEVDGEPKLHSVITMREGPYPLSVHAGASGVELLEKLAALSDQLRDAEVDFRVGAPRPTPELRISPRG